MLALARPDAQRTTASLRSGADGDGSWRKVHVVALRTRAVTRTLPPAAGSLDGDAATETTTGFGLAAAAARGTSAAEVPTPSTTTKTASARMQLPSASDTDALCITE